MTYQKNTTYIQDENRAERGCYATLKELRLNVHGIEYSDFWNFITHSWKLESKNEITVKQYTRLEARLRAAKRDRRLYTSLIQKVKSYKQRIAQPAPAPVIEEVPHNGQFYIYNVLDEQGKTVDVRVSKNYDGKANFLRKTVGKQMTDEYVSQKRASLKVA